MLWGYKLQVTRYTFFESPGAYQPLLLCSIPRYEEKHFVQWVALALFMPLITPTCSSFYCWYESLYSYSIEYLHTVTRLWTVARLVLCPNYSRMLSVATERCKNPVYSFLVENAIQANLWRTNFIHEHVSITWTVLHSNHIVMISCITLWHVSPLPLLPWSCRQWWGVLALRSGAEQHLVVCSLPQNCGCRWPGSSWRAYLTLCHGQWQVGGRWCEWTGLHLVR